MMKKTAIRGAMGFPIGISVGYVITILISAVQSDGQYYPCAPSLAAEFGSELSAVIFQAVLCGVLGTAFAAASVIWETERWSLAKQTGIYFLTISLAMLPVAYFSHWMDHTPAGFASYFGSFLFIFAAIWIIQYLVWKSRIRSMNASIRGKK